MKTKIKAHGAEVIDFYDKTFPKVDYNDTWVILNGNLSDFSSSDESDESGKEKIKAVCLSFESVFFEVTFFLKEQ